MTELAIPDTFTCSEEWWLPREDGTQPEGCPPNIAGTLTWKAQRANLELHGALTPLRGLIFSNAEHSYAAIHGITTQSQHVTVLDALKLGSPMNLGAAGVRETERVSSGWVVVGAHVTPQSLYNHDAGAMETSEQRHHGNYHHVARSPHVC